MAVTILDSPQKITPAYNPSWFVLTSDAVDEENFNYVLDFYQVTGSTMLTDRIIRVRIPGEPTSGYGDGVYNSQKIVQNYVQPTFNPSITGITSQDFFEYNILFGETYTYYWPFTDNQYYTGYTYNLGFSGLTDHQFTVGDIVEVEQFSGATNPDYDGVWTIVAIPTPNAVVVNRNILFNTPPEGGTIVLANKAVTTFSALTTGSTYIGCNAAIDTTDFIDYNVYDYYPTTGATKGEFFTNAFNGYKVRRTNRGLFNTVDLAQFDKIRVETTDTTGGTEDYQLIQTGSTQSEVNYVGAGPWNLTYSSGYTALSGATFPIIKDDTASYKIWLEDSSNIRMTEQFQFTIYDYCGKWDNYEFLFLDRKGSWMPFNFELVQRKMIDIKRTSFKQGLGTYSYNNRNVTYNSYDRGTKVINNNLMEKYTVVSNWLTENQSLYFEEILSSPFVYWNKDGAGTFVAVNVTKLSDEIKDKKNSRLIQYTLEFELANNPMIQLGS